MADKDFKVKSGLDLPTPLPVSMGGTGQTSTSGFLNNLLPSQGNNAGKALQTDGTNVSWVTLPNGYSIGNTASRPQSPSNGQIYSNTQTGFVEIYNSTFGWEVLGSLPSVVNNTSAQNQGSGRAFNNGSATVSFSPGSIPGRSYSAFSIPSTSTFTSSSSPITFTGLASGTSYVFVVSAINNYGSSAGSQSGSITATTVPQAPTISSVTAGNAQVSVDFTAGATGGTAITSYTVTSSPGNITATGSSSPIVVTGLTNGTAYTFTVRATNANGTSAASTASTSVTPVAPPPDTLPLLGAWTQGATHPAGAYASSHWGTTIVNSNSRVYVVDGDRSSAAYRYNDGKGGSWTTVTSRPAAQIISPSSKTYTSDNRVYTVGGDTGDGFQTLSANAEGTSWSTYSALDISASWGNGASFNGQMWVTNNLAGPSHFTRRGSTNNGISWSSYANTPLYIYGHSAAALHNKLVVWGGFQSGWVGSTKVYATDGNGSWTTETDAPHAGNTFFCHGMASNGTDKSRIYTSNNSSSLWSRSHNSGTWQAETSAPGGRSYAVIHSVRNGNEIWIQASMTDTTIWYQRLV